MVPNFPNFENLQKNFEEKLEGSYDDETTLNQEKKNKVVCALNFFKNWQKCMKELHLLITPEEKQLNKEKKEGKIDPSYDLHFSKYERLLKKISLKTQLSCEIHKLNQIAFTYFLETTTDCLQKIAIQVND